MSAKELHSRPWTQKGGPEGQMPDAASALGQLENTEEIEGVTSLVLRGSDTGLWTMQGISPPQ